MVDFFVAISEDGVRFKLRRDGTWEPDATPENKHPIRFRSSNWGDDLAKVKAVESNDPVHETDDWLMYETNVGGFPAMQSFNFVNDLFCMGLYRFTQEHANKNDFIDDFETLKRLLAVKYGEPSETKDYWFNDLYKDDYAERGMAVASGHYAIFVTWGR